ncbi:MAG: HEAT repeat domain-containing protein [Planctomycetota bacterium]|jgi:hypothetical protein|nr:HEAT repeat domain-containing protein [Planctomycetota bacterium]MDP6761794.1 HEAT repeat domain-containing protein [Planctomycetota bacterium]
MEILFCDLCNESVPESDLCAGRAVRLKGRVVCASCEASMGGLAGEAKSTPSPPPAPEPPPFSQGVPRSPTPQSPPSAPAPPSRGGRGLVVGAVALVFAVTAAVYLGGELEDLRRTASDERSALDGGVTGVRIDMARVLGRVDSLGSELTARMEARIEETREALAGELDALGRDLAAAGEVATDLETRLARVDRQRTDSDAELERRLGELAFQLRSSREDVRSLAERMGSVERTGGGGAVAVEPVPPAAILPPWNGELEGLASENAGTRWNAVQALGETADPAVVPHLLDLLGDEDVFVRMAVARVLGDLKVPTSVDRLIDALEDSEAVVRESAMVSLRDITGRNFKFDAVGSASDRAKKVKAWRQWWSKARDGFEPSG